MSAMSNFNNLQARQNAIFGHRSTSPQSVFDNTSAEDRIFDTFSDMAQNEGGNPDFVRLYGNGASGEPLENVGDVWS